MRPILLIFISAGVLGLAAFLGGATREGDVPVRLRIVDAENGKAIGGMVRVFAKGKDMPLKLTGLLDRMRGLDKSDIRAGWHVVPVAGGEVTLPRGKLRLEAVHGLETALVRHDVDLTAAPGEITVRLPFLFRPEAHGLAAGNTHLHLRNMTRAEADDYLRTIPASEGLKVLFISYLERHLDDRNYITNSYPAGDLDFPGSGTLTSNGEEHRHNFAGYGQGYGHVMFLGIKQFVKPASLGPGITGGGDDDRPLRPGIDEARRQGGTIVWCHNSYGHEDVPSMISGRLDALNVFDGSRRDTYEDTYYRFLNLGLRVPISTGTDWFLYDFSRVYARTEGPLSVPGWLDALKKGRSVATNGPLLTLTLDGKPIGEAISLKDPKAIRIEASAIGRHDFQKLQLVHNGKVIQTEPSRADKGSHRAQLTRDAKIAEPGWFAVRIETATKNEFDTQLFAHSSPVYVDLDGRSVFDVESAQALLRQVEESRADIRARGRFSSDPARDKLLAQYDDAAGDLRARINKRGK